MDERDIVTDDGRTLHAYDRGGGARVVLWHHGTPNIGTPPRPLYAAADRLGLRLIGYDRPGYGGSTPLPGRDVASAARDAAAVADALGVESFAVIGHSGGGPHALACAALLPDRVTAAVSVSGLSPRHDETWFDGMGPAGVAGLRAAIAGRAVKEAHEAVDAAPDFTPADWAALAGEWGWFGEVVEPAVATGPGPLIDDDLAYVHPWGFDPAAIKAPVLLVHGADDLVVPAAHARDLVPGAESWIVAGAGHISVLPETAVRALEWLAVRT
ncbi:pimeloyl-ACP methyl ester carboxylesterase [Catenuloplanes nepalensis]|uniref:Pimeloyl-ACP methyl ester carboxylesterase n=1 Tax=Catenuloplanes nepalensis TaxID=587533 RepID=A0ABT9MR94_9ACTN|nr:alpha/beta fold hydrolase [Catenuloplanes nepalensis]MDP9793551.1 pimeloyl-ACP methyl ester carboxylesterase [Catenuloplanes nepalensis]